MGIKSGLNEAFIISSKVRDQIVSMHPTSNMFIKPYVGGRDLDRWRHRWEDNYLLYINHGFAIEEHESIEKHLHPFKKKLTARATKQAWFELQQPQSAYTELLDGPKIIFPDISRYPKFSLDKDSVYFSNTVYFISSESLFLLGVLNSRLLWFVVRGLSNALRGGMWRFRLFSGHIEQLPIRTIDFSDAADKAKHDQMVTLVERMLDLHNGLADAKTRHDKTTLQRQIDATDTQIDRLVYDLYGLTDEEIKIVEDATK